MAGLGVLAAFAALSGVLLLLARPLFEGLRVCDTEVPPVAGAIEAFLRENTAGVAFGPSEVVLCDSVPGVVVELTARTAKPDVAAVAAALEAGGCGPVTGRGVGYEARTCTLPTGERFTVEIVTRGSFVVFGSISG